MADFLIIHSFRRSLSMSILKHICKLPSLHYEKFYAPAPLVTKIKGSFTQFVMVHKRYVMALSRVLGGGIVEAIFDKDFGLSGEEESNNDALTMEICIMQQHNHRIMYILIIGAHLGYHLINIIDTSPDHNDSYIDNSMW